MSEERITESSTGGKKGIKPRRYDLIPPSSLAALADVYGMGAEKYDDTNWVKGYSWRYSYGAMQRHVEAARDGEWTDPESGLPHLAHAAWHMFTLMYYQEYHFQYSEFNDMPWG